MVIAFLPITGSKGDEKPQCINKSKIAITDDGYRQSDPSVFGQFVAWEDDRNDGHSKLYYFDMNRSEELPVIEDVIYQQQCDIYGDQMVYIGSVTNSSHGLVLYDLRSREATLLLESYGVGDLRHYYQNPAINGKNIIYSVGSNNGDIYLYNLTTGEEIPICTNNATQTNPDIWGDYVVWTDGRNNRTDIYYYDLENGTEHRLTTNPYTQGDASIYGNHIVWLDYRHGKGNLRGQDVYCYDIETGITRRISYLNTSLSPPRIYDDFIVWSHYDLYLHRISTNTTYQLTDDDTEIMQINPDIWGNKIVYESNEGGEVDIWLLEFEFVDEEPNGTGTNGENGDGTNGDGNVTEDDENGSSTPFVTAGWIAVAVAAAVVLVVWRRRR